MSRRARRFTRINNRKNLRGAVKSRPASDGLEEAGAKRESTRGGGVACQGCSCVCARVCVRTGSGSYLCVRSLEEQQLGV